MAHATESNSDRREDGTIVLDRRIETSGAALDELFGGRPPMRIVIESSTESEWVAQHLEQWGHDVIVADPNYAAMYGTRSRRVKTDKRDAVALAEACRTGVYRQTHRLSAPARQLRQQMRVRQHLVDLRRRNLVRALVRQDGHRLASGSAEHVVVRLDRLALPAPIAAILAPLRTTLTQVTALLAEIEEIVEARAGDATTQPLTAPRVGPVVALTFQAVLDDPQRFGGSAARASACVGLVPLEGSSAERQHKGHITKTGPRDLRALLVQASWVIWRGRSQAGAAHVGADARRATRAPHCDRRVGPTTDADALNDVARSTPLSATAARGHDGGVTADPKHLGRSGRADSRDGSTISSMAALESRDQDDAPSPRITYCAATDDCR